MMIGVALVTGGGSGIGRAISLKFASVGYNVAVVDINRKSAEETVQLITEPKAIVVEADVSKSEDVARMVTQVVDSFGRIDVCCNNAGVESDRRLVHLVTEEDWDRVMNINLRGTWLCMKYEIKQFLEQEPTDPGDPLRKKIRGGIVNTISTCAAGTFPEFSPYCASKWGLLGLTKTAASEYADKGIRINGVGPCTTDTPMVERFAERWPEWQAAMNKSHKFGRVCSPEEVAEAVFWLGSNQCPFVSGEVLYINGGK